MQTLSFTDLIIFNDQGLTDLSLLLTSNLTTRCNSISIISPNKIEIPDASSKLTNYSDVADYFEIYNKLESVAKELQGKYLLIIKSGVEPTSGFCDYLNSMTGRPLEIFFCQDTHCSPKGTLADFLMEPLFPSATFINRNLSMIEEPFKSKYLELTFWETAIRAYRNIGSYPSFVSKHPFLRETKNSNPIANYRLHLTRSEPERAKELRADKTEWNEHLSNIHAAVIDEHQELFAAYCSTLIPELCRKTRSLSEWKRILTVPGGDEPALLPSWKLSAKLLLNQISTLVSREKKHGPKSL